MAKLKRKKRIERKRVPEEKEEEIPEVAYEEKRDKLILKYKHLLPPGIETELEKMSWEAIANLAHTFQVKITRETKELRKLDREIALTRLILQERIKYGAARKGFDSKFLVDLVRLLERLEKLAIQYEVDLDEFLLFIYILIEKMKKERLIVYEPSRRTFIGKEKLTEFARLKETAEKLR